MEEIQNVDTTLRRDGLKMSELLNKYKNGNYRVEIYSDGTKYRIARTTKLKPKFPESMDLKITNYCDLGCPMCHEMSTKEGKHGNLKHHFFKTLKAGTELAIGGGNPLSHPGLEEFLIRMKKQGVICNMTVNQKHFMEENAKIFELSQRGLITALGISLSNSNDNMFIELVRSIKNTVLHVINGIFDKGDYENLKNKGLKVLILGYKKHGRGLVYYNDEVQSNMEWLKDSIHYVAKGFDIASFDNLAIKQLYMRRFFSKNDWGTYYMGDDGRFTMYVDVVLGLFAKSSVAETRYHIKRNIKSMFNVVRLEANEWE